MIKVNFNHKIYWVNKIRITKVKIFKIAKDSIKKMSVLVLEVKFAKLNYGKEYKVLKKFNN